MDGLSVIVKGRVQGVGFRYFTHNLANSMDLSGWVRNLRDGSVEVLAIGPKQVLERFLQEYNNFRVVTWKKVWNKGSSLGEAGDFSQSDSPTFKVTPHQDGMDGFFAAVIERAVPRHNDGATNEA